MRFFEWGVEVGTALRWDQRGSHASLRDQGLMILHLSELSSEPLQAQIVRQIRAAILAGSLSEGELLPSIRTLARESKVSVITVQRAYGTLENEGVIRSRRGKGFYVNAVYAPDRHRLAFDRLKEALGPIVQTAVAEGMSGTAIRRAFVEIPDNARQQSTITS